MRITPLIQGAVIDVATWEPDAEFAVFPQGARAKDAVFAPDNGQPAVIVPGKRYMFKRSKKSYPDQFWGEVVAYRIGCILGMQVPPAFAAVNSQMDLCGALIEWFYQDSAEMFVLGGDFMQQVREGFDRSKGRQHNLQDVEVLMRAFARTMPGVRASWTMWWARALLFDALIGNTDRHQDNWGLIFQLVKPGKKPDVSTLKLAPLFDNGTSLGHERFGVRVDGWPDSGINLYVAKGKHHIKWDLVENPPLQQHFELLQRVLVKWSEFVDIDALRAAVAFDSDEFEACIVDLAHLPMPERLSPERMRFMLRLLRRRHTLLKELLDDPTAPLGRA